MSGSGFVFWSFRVLNRLGFVVWFDLVINDFILVIDEFMVYFVFLFYIRCG